MGIFEAFQYDFLQRAFYAGLIISVLAPLIGTFLVVRRLSFLADTLAHVSLLGIAIALILGLSPIVGAVVVSLLAALGVERLRSGGHGMTEATLALFLSVSLAAAVVLVSFADISSVSLMSYLFGSLATVSEIDLWFLFALAALAALFFFRSYKALFLSSLDEELAAVSGVPVRFVNVVFVSFAAFSAAASLRIVGALLLGALMVVPVLSALQFGRGFRGTLGLAISISVISFLVGFFLAYVFDLPSGGTIVLSAGAIFILSLLLGKVLRRV